MTIFLGTEGLNHKSGNTHKTAESWHAFGQKIKNAYKDSNNFVSFKGSEPIYKKNQNSALSIINILENNFRNDTERREYFDIRNARARRLMLKK